MLPAECASSRLHFLISELLDLLKLSLDWNEGLSFSTVKASVYIKCVSIVLIHAETLFQKLCTHKNIEIAIWSSIFESKILAIPVILYGKTPAYHGNHEIRHRSEVLFVNSRSLFPQTARKALWRSIDSFVSLALQEKLGVQWYIVGVPEDLSQHLFSSNVCISVHIASLQDTYYSPVIGFFVDGSSSTRIRERELIVNRWGASSSHSGFRAALTFYHTKILTSHLFADN